jgi:hypothetical protein
MQLERLVGICIEADHRGALGLAAASLSARPARPRRTPGGDDDGGEHPEDRQQARGPGRVAHCRTMARRRFGPRTTKGDKVRAGALAIDAIRKIVPPDQLQLTRVRASWREITEGRLRAVAWPASLRSGILTVHVRDNQWLHELTYLRGHLLQRVQRTCPDAGVTDLRVRVGQVHVPRELPPEPEAPPPPALDDEPSRETWEALSAIEDPDLRQAIANTRMALSKRVRG